MRSSKKKLLISPLAATVLCSSGASALTGGQWAAITGTGLGLGAMAAIGIGAACARKSSNPVVDNNKYTNEDPNLNIDEASSLSNGIQCSSHEKNVQATRDTITKVLGEQKCKVLFDCNHYFKYNFSKSVPKFVGFDDQFLKDVTSLKLTKKGKTEELSNKEAVSSFLNDKSAEINGWDSEDIIDDLEEAFKPIAVGFSTAHGVCKTSREEESFWGKEGLAHHNDFRWDYSYRIYVSNDCKSVKVCYYNNYGSSFEAIIDVSGNH